MKKLFTILLTIITLLSLTACGNTPSGSSAANKDSQEETFAVIKESPDKYTWYIKNYVGRNCASFGKTYSSSGYRYDEYGWADIKFVFIAEDGSYVDAKDEESLKNYVVTAQSIAPNTELKLVFQKNSKGEEYDNLVEKQNIEEIELHVKRVTDNSIATE